MNPALLYPAAIGAAGVMAGATRHAAGAAGSFAQALNVAAEGASGGQEASSRLKAQQALAGRVASAEGPHGLESLYRALAGRAPRYPGEPIHLEDMRSHAQERLADLGREVRDRVDAAGLDASQPIRIQIGVDGRVVVAGDHPDREAIEKLLNADPELANQLRQIAAAFDMLRAADEHQEFAAAYAQDPARAVAQFSHLFDGGEHDPVQLLLDEHDSRAVIE